VLQQIDSAPAWTVLALDYELGYLLEPRSAPPGWQPDGRPLARCWRFRDCVALSADEAAQWLADRQVANRLALLAGRRRWMKKLTLLRSTAFKR
jgi:hypothetical protein